MAAAGWAAEAMAIRFVFAGCCARATSGDAAAPLMSEMNSRRFMPIPEDQTIAV